MNVELHAKIQYKSTRLSTIISGDISCLLFLKTLGCLNIPNHTQLNQYNDPIVPCIDVQLHKNSQNNNSTVNNGNTFQKY